MKKYAFILFALLSLTSCTKDEPTPEIDQEELGGAKLIFTAVEKQEIDGKVSYLPVEGEEVQEIKFDDKTFLPEAGAHVDLEEGHTYKMDLIAYDFLKREVQQTFLNKPENHQAFLLGADEKILSFEYGDEHNVGISNYITIHEGDKKVQLQYIMCHLTAAAKQTLKASDWNNPDISVGSVDLKLVFEVHLVKEDHHH